MIRIDREAPAEAGARESLLDLALGRRRRKKTSERLREGRLPAEGLSFSARTGKRPPHRHAAALARFRRAPIGRRLLLGPLAVHPSYRNRGIGSALMRTAIDRRRRSAIAPCCSWATSLITSASVSRAHRPSIFACPARSNATVFSRSNSFPARFVTRAEWSSRPARRRRWRRKNPQESRRNR